MNNSVSGEFLGKSGEPVWASIIPEDQWAVYLEAIHRTRATGARFVLGGAFGLAGHTGRWRNTKDLDFFVLPSDRQKVIDALLSAGFRDYYEKLPYDRGWIFRFYKNDIIVDVIWSTPNRRTEVDELWFEKAPPIKLQNENLAIIPAEELLCIKSYVLQRDRCDWPDLINLLHVKCGELNWDHVIARMGEDLPLIAGLLQVFDWVDPVAAAKIPSAVRKRVCLSQKPSGGQQESENRVRLLDSRPWYAAFQPMDKPMQL